MYPNEYEFGDDALVDESGSIRPDKMPTFRDAYRRDILESNAYLTEGEGNLAAQRLGIIVRVFEGSLPEGYQRIENPGGGNCLLHALMQACRVHNSQEIPAGASDDEIKILREYIARNISDEVIDPLVTTAVLGQVLGFPEPGLGQNMRQLLAHSSITVATRIMLEKEDSGVSKSPSSKSLSQSKTQKKEGAEPAQEQQAVATFGSGEEPLANIALLHIGAHYVMIMKKS